MIGLDAWTSSKKTPPVGEPEEMLARMTGAQKADAAGARAAWPSAYQRPVV
jgi:hypothetical protein